MSPWGMTTPPPDRTPTPVIMAVLLMSLLFLGSIAYLWLSIPWMGVEARGLVDIRPVTVAVVPYRGTLWKMEAAREPVRAALEEQGVLPGPAFTWHTHSPKYLRPIAVECRIGYVVPAGTPELNGISVVHLNPGRRYIMWVQGKGNFTGGKAYKRAETLLKAQGLQPADGERYELRERVLRKYNVEHWIPVQGK